MKVVWEGVWAKPITFIDLCCWLILIIRLGRLSLILFFLLFIILWISILIFFILLYGFPITLFIVVSLFDNLWICHVLMMTIRLKNYLFFLNFEHICWFNVLIWAWVRYKWLTKVVHDFSIIFIGWELVGCSFFEIDKWKKSIANMEGANIISGDREGKGDEGGEYERFNH